jgi:hypothetical protein
MNPERPWVKGVAHGKRHRPHERDALLRRHACQTQSSAHPGTSGAQGSCAIGVVWTHRVLELAPGNVDECVDAQADRVKVDVDVV